MRPPLFKIITGFLLAKVSFSFAPRYAIRHPVPMSLSAATSSLPDVDIVDDTPAVGEKIRSIVQESAQKAIAEHGYFALAIPGGSILKMLVGDDILGEWTEKTIIAYVNHKCVDMDDGELATHAKARNLFLDNWKGTNTIILDGTDDGDAEASSYDSKLKALSEAELPRDEAGLPVFDLALIGVGDDGHIGSLYPDREEVLVGPDGPWVVPVAMKDPPSITLTLPVMTNAKKVIVAACGVSDKYPQGKSAGMRRAIVEEETLQSFPASGLRHIATWVMDKAAASKLGNEFNAN